MPWRLIEFIVIFAVFLLFIVFNLRNNCDISFGFVVIKDVPVFLTAFFSFFAGMICAFPFIIGFFKLRKRAKTVEGKGLLAKASSRRANKKFGEKPGENSADSGLLDKTHYGID